MIRIFGVFEVQSHAMRLYMCMCMCCGLFAPTQFNSECCGVRDESCYMYVHIYTFER